MLYELKKTYRMCLQRSGDFGQRHRPHIVQKRFSNQPASCIQNMVLQNKKPQNRINIVAIAVLRFMLQRG